MLLKFSSATITDCTFVKNWVSVGGTQISAGGAVAGNFNNTNKSISQHQFYELSGTCLPLFQQSSLSIIKHLRIIRIMASKY